MVETKEPDGEDKPAPAPFGGEDALALAREGKDAWNAWADKKENAGREVDFTGVDFTARENQDIYFYGFTFPGVVRFAGAMFPDAEFAAATFEGDAWFDKATFAGDAGFGGATFEGDAQFGAANFKGAAGFGAATFEAAAGFDKATFAGDAWFAAATFEGDAHFGAATFEAGAGFDKATFEGNAGFDGATFKGYARFAAATFEGNAGFSGGTFTGPVLLGKSQFRIVPDFRRSEFNKHVTLHGMEVDFRRPTEPTDADMYRRLKEIAVNARDHDREQMIFAYELMAKRGHETRGLALAPNYLYGWLNGFGRNLLRPGAGLFIVWFGFGILYHRLAAKDMSGLGDGLLFSAAQIFPFLGASRGTLAGAKIALFGEAALNAGINALAMIEGGLGILFLFLIGLALRNRFRL